MTNNIRLNMGVSVVPSTDDVYEDVVDIERYIPSDHRYLLQFFSSGMHDITRMLKEAVASEDRGLVFKAETLLLSVHRYFERPERIRSYINRSLADMIWSDENTGSEKMDEVFDNLALFDKYTERDPSYWLSLEDGKGTIQSLACMQEDLCSMIPIVFDDSNKLSVYPQRVRNGLYGLVSHDPAMRAKISLVPGRVVLPSPAGMEILRARMDFDDDFMDSIYSSVGEAVNGLSVPPVLRETLDHIHDAESTESWTEYDTPYLEDVLRLEVSLMISSGTRFKKCVDCGRYFSVTDDNDMYCDIPDADGNSCLSKHREKEMEETLKAVYTQAYRTHHKRVKKGNETKESLDAWRDIAKMLQADVLNGNLSVDEYKREIMKTNR